ncbi:hypothetical protein DL770_000260 [Monosporascus sp. CRB-9-2]|nr:hypothetical protein DL770_000260 [Monosporascus sp. CRB-9-2]
MASAPGSDDLKPPHQAPAPEVVGGDDEKGRQDAPGNPLADVIRNAKLASEKEHKMTLMQGVKLYPKAIAWSVLISTCIIMEGYDIALVNNFYALDQFNRKYGEQLPDGTWQVPAPWQAGLSNGAVVGEIFGLMLNGWASERFGYRITVIACLIMVTAFISIYFTAQTVVHLQVASILCGIPWGVFQTLTITYASEVCPVALRGYLTTYINMCWGIGQMLGIATIMGNLWRADEWAYRIPYALQWMWPLPLAIGIFFAPESPWWLVRRQKLEEAKKSLLRLTSLGRGTDFDADETVAMMVHTTALEQKAGLESNTAYAFALGQYAINCVGVIGAWGLITLGIGRRTLYLVGLAALCCMLLILGFLGLAEDRTAASLATGCIMLVWALCYQLTVGTVCYSLVAELSTRRLQIKTVVLGRILYNIVGIICGVLTPYMLNPGSWDWGNFAGFFWAGLCFLCLIYTYFRVPEPSGRTFAELDLLFEKKVSARKFASTNVDVFAEDVEDDMMDKYQAQIHIANMEKELKV